jgi:TolA-binding protein
MQEQRLATAQSANADSEPAADTGLSRLGSFMRKGAFTPTTSSHPISPREQELEKVLVKEQKARAVAEEKTRQVNAEVEELSTTLFQQANEMVATERRQNAALQAKIQELEKAGGNVAEVVGKENERLKERLQIMEQRDLERQKRLERLEAAQKRIDRVRTMLMPR